MLHPWPIKPFGSSFAFVWRTFPCIFFIIGVLCFLAIAHEISNAWTFKLLHLNVTLSLGLFSVSWALLKSPAGFHLLQQESRHHHQAACSNRYRVGHFDCLNDAIKNEKSSLGTLLSQNFRVDPLNDCSDDFNWCASRQQITDRILSEVAKDGTFDA